MPRMTRKEFLDGIKQAMEGTPESPDKAALREKVMSMAQRPTMPLNLKPVNKQVNNAGTK